MGGVWGDKKGGLHDTVEESIRANAAIDLAEASQRQAEAAERANEILRETARRSDYSRTSSSRPSSANSGVMVYAVIGIICAAVVSNASGVFAGVVAGLFWPLILIYFLITWISGIFK